jgi:checkpoint serine/threonine-protein kinase
MKRKHTSEPTMTMHTKAATEDIYDIFNAPSKVARPDDAGDDFGYDTDDYTSGAESTGTTRNLSTSEAGDEEYEQSEVAEEREEADENETSDNVSEWSEFSVRRHVPQVDDEDENGQGNDADDGHNVNDTQISDLIDIRDHGSSRDQGESSEDEVDDDDEQEEWDLPVVSPGKPSPPRTRTVFIPIPPEDYVPPTRPYRDPVEMANNRLPFMTPITERTETSLDIRSASPGMSVIGEHMPPETPSKGDELMIAEEDEDSSGLEVLSSPLREVLSAEPQAKIPQPLLQKPAGSAAKKGLAQSRAIGPPLSKGPIVKDKQCNPVDDSVRNEILSKMQPPLSSYEAFYDHRDEKYEKGADVRKFAKAIGKAGARTSTDKTGTLGSPVTIQFPDTTHHYTIRKELGAGAFAPVYLVENSRPTTDATDENGQADDADARVAVMGKGAFALAHQRRGVLEALKMEDPPTAWEFHMMRLAHTRLGPQHRAAASLSSALELHLYRDECFLFLPFHPHGTLLDVVNLFRAEPSGVMDETLAMFFTVEALRTTEALHSHAVLHGDLKVDNCLLRLPTTTASTATASSMASSASTASGTTSDAAMATAEPLESQWRASGTGGWSARGLTLIDFGRGIDMRAFVPGVQFIADWKTSAQDCAEMREGRPWTWQIDYHGLAGIVHCLLFGKYIETVRCDGATGGVGGSGRRYKIRESLKRYWQTDIWSECFDLLLNPGAFVEVEDGAKMPVLRSMKRVRERMEVWLEANCEKGVGLRAHMVKIENWVKGRR